VLRDCASHQSAPPVRLRVSIPGQHASVSAPAARDAALGLHPDVAAEADEVAERDAHAEHLAAAQAVPVRGHDARHRPHDAGRDAQQRTALADRLERARHVAVLEVAKAPVHDLQTLRGGAGAEVAALEQADREPAQRRFVRGAHAVDPAADDRDVPRFARDPGEVALHAAAGRRNARFQS
jgi:hypothetical protein